MTCRPARPPPSPSAGSRQGRQSGFTLIELMVVLAVAALLVGVATVALHRPQGRPLLSSTARQVASAFRAARMEAILRGRPQTVTVDVARGSWEAPGVPPHYVPQGVHAVLFTEEDLVEARRRGFIRFYPDGSSTGGGLSLEASGIQYEVLVSWVTGGVTIHERPPQPRKPASL